MDATTLTLHPAFPVGEVDERVFGGFLEHLGRAVYDGIYNPGSAHADVDGFRTDVLDALRTLDMTTMRYPGGNFVSGYHWIDGVGPKDERPTVQSRAWHTVETNAFGTDEFIRLCRRMSWTPMFTVNLGTGTPEEAADWVEYTNADAGTVYADMRVENGFPDPHGVKLWCLGNELDGPWQLGHVPAREYALRAQQAAGIMKAVDPDIELVACGSSGVTMPTYAEWDRTVLGIVGDSADYISLHRYVENVTDDTADYLAVTRSIDRQIEEIDAVCRCVQAERGSAKRAYLSFDEWNVWFQHRRRRQRDTGLGPVENYYTLEDALVVAGFLNSFLRHADVVKIANLAQIVNVIAPVVTRGDDLLVQSIYHAFEMFSKRRRGVSLRVSLDGPTYASPSYGTVHTVDASSILDGDRLHVFAVNRSLDATAEVRLNVPGAAVREVENAELLTGPAPDAANSFDEPDVVRSRAFDDVEVKTAAARALLPSLSLTALTFRLDR
ncbi:MAG TPA: alpha-L-arabinofuranosidase C-terminal domain-containing protein [Planctomycetota bacterium]|nr:alpha-L-arabinofuranosidase C-terminal domain-containing protein [Planctomycetota bacterium]